MSFTYKRDWRCLRNPAWVLKWAELRFSAYKNKNGLQCRFYCTASFSASWSLSSFPPALVTMIRCMSIWVSAWPQPAFSTHWQKLRVNCGRHCKGEWLWDRTINSLNLAPAHSYCTYFNQCIKSAFRDRKLSPTFWEQTWWMCWLLLCLKHMGTFYRTVLSKVF